MPAAMPRQKDDLLSIQLAKTKFVGRPAERAFDAAPDDIGQPVDPVKTAAADNPDDAVGHRAAARGLVPGPYKGRLNAGCATRSCASRRRIGRSSPAETARP